MIRIPLHRSNSTPRRLKFGLPAKVIAVLLFIGAILLSILFLRLIPRNPDSSTPVETTSSDRPTIPLPMDLLLSLNNFSTKEPQRESTSIASIQDTINYWATNLDNSVSVSLLLYDLDHDELLASLNPDQPMNVASIYKLFYAYTGYLAIEAGDIAPGSRYVTTSDYRAGSYTFAECLDLILRESYNGCADHMYDDPRATKHALALIDDLGLPNTKNRGLTSTASDLTKLLYYYWQHPGLSADSWAKLADSLLNQSPTEIAPGETYDWRQGLPAGFSQSVNVYDKVGWEWNGNEWAIYADAAILEFPAKDRHFSLVVITSGITTLTPYPLQNLAKSLEPLLAELP